jgi:hypothetical protein
MDELGDLIAGLIAVARLDGHYEVGHQRLVPTPPIALYVIFYQVALRL